MEIVLITFTNKENRTIRSTKKYKKTQSTKTTHRATQTTKKYIEQHNRKKYIEQCNLKDYIQKNNSLTRKSSVCAPYFRGIPWHLPYKLRRKARKNLGQASRRMPFGTMKAEYTEQNIDNKKKINMTINLKITINIDV